MRTLYVRYTYFIRTVKACNRFNCFFASLEPKSGLEWVPPLINLTFLIPSKSVASQSAFFEQRSMPSWINLWTPMVSCNVAHHHLRFCNSALVKFKFIKILRNDAFWQLLLAEHRIVFASPTQMGKFQPNVKVPSQRETARPNVKLLTQRQNPRAL